MNRKKKLAVAAAVLLVLALLVEGAFAWIDFSQSFANRFRGGGAADVLLHDDFEPWKNKDVYVENMGDNPLIVRVLFREFLQIGNIVLAGTDVNKPHRWPVHLYDTNIPHNGCPLPTHTYFQWDMTGAQKTYLHGTSEQGNENYDTMIGKIIAANGLNIPAADGVENPDVIGPNGRMFGKTAAAEAVVHMSQWMGYTRRQQLDTACWVLDTDGWAYWSQLLRPGEATNLLLDNVTMIKPPDDNYVYQIDVQLQAANLSEWKRLTHSMDRLPGITQEALDEIVEPILDEEEDVEITVNTANPVDVQLAVGMTDVDYRDFETDLRAALADYDPALTDDDLFITTGAKVSATNTTEQFSWWTYDHTKPAGTLTVAYNGVPIIDHNSHIYVETDGSPRQTGSYGSGVSPAPGPVNNSDSSSYGYTPYSTNPDIGYSVHPYTGNERHMLESNNGATMDFYGYGQNAYKDFMILPSGETSVKTFEFAIEEDLAFDALDGAGFFFNVEIYGGDYGAVSNPQMMKGYLLFLTYDGNGVGSNMSIYKFKDVNVKNFHHNWNASSGTGTHMADLTSGANLTFTKVASSTVYTSAHYSRKIKVEVSPDSVTAWYRGSTAKKDASVTNVPIPDGTLPVTWTMTANGQPGQGSSSQQTTVSLDPNYVASYGFGPMCSYVGHGCARPTHMTFKNLSMTMERPRSLLEILHESAWEDGDNSRFIVNLNERTTPDFEDSGVTGEILELLQDGDVYYIGWCGDENEAQSQTFLNKYAQNGALVNMDNMTYSQQIKAIADAVYALYWRPDVGDVVLTTDKTVLEVQGADRTGTADSHWPGGKWKVVHRLGGIDNPQGTHPLSGQDLPDLDIRFNKPGYYDIYYKDDLVKTVFAHRAPVAAFTVPALTSTAYDPDDTANGIVQAAWSYIDLDAGTAVHPGKPAALVPGHVYLVRLEVTDRHGERAVAAKAVGG